jgi:hypothetical protein
MNKQTTKRAVAVAVVGAVMLGSVPPSWAAPISSSMKILKQAAPSSGVTDVRYATIATIEVAAITAIRGPQLALASWVLRLAPPPMGPMDPATMGQATMGRATTRQATTAPPIPIAAATTISIDGTIGVVWA